MAEPSLKQQFLRLLREVMRRSGMQRKELMCRLGISASAMSQIFSGAMLPSQKRLDQLCEILHPALEEAESLQSMLYWLRSGRNRMPSDANRRLFMLRCRSGLTIRELAERSSISEARLRRLENSGGSRLSDDEIARLLPILECSAEDLNIDAAYGGAVSLPATAAEEDTVSLPRLELCDLEEYSEAEHIGNFAFDHARDFVERGLLSASATAVVCAEADELKAVVPGHFALTLGDRRPEEFLELELCRGEKGGFFVRGIGAGIFGAPPENEEVRWALPILELCYIPKKDE